MPSSGRQPILSTAKGNNKYKGVTRQARPGRSVKFLVQYRVDGVMKNFGSYDSELDAAIAYAASIDKNIPGRKTALTAASIDKNIPGRKTALTLMKAPAKVARKNPGTRPASSKTSSTTGKSSAPAKVAKTGAVTAGTASGESVGTVGSAPCSDDKSAEAALHGDPPTDAEDGSLNSDDMSAEAALHGDPPTDTEDGCGAFHDSVDDTELTSENVDPNVALPKARSKPETEDIAWVRSRHSERKLEVMLMMLLTMVGN